MAATTSVFIVDDHHMVIEGIHALLRNENKLQWLGHATRAASCLAFLQQQQPDVIFMDINLPDRSGIELCKEVKEKYPSVFVIGLSTFNQESFVTRMMESGASGYVLKNATRDELLLAIETVMRGKIYMSLEAAEMVEKKPEEGVPLLTRREKEVLSLIADGLTTQEIATQLFVSVTTIDTHRKNLLVKFNARNVAAMIKMAMQHQII